MKVLCAALGAAFSDDEFWRRLATAAARPGSKRPHRTRGPCRGGSQHRRNPAVRPRHSARNEIDKGLIESRGAAHARDARKMNLRRPTDSCRWQPLP